VETETIQSNVDRLLRFLGFVKSKYHLRASELTLDLLFKPEITDYTRQFVHFLEERGTAHSTIANYIHDLIQVCKYHLNKGNVRHSNTLEHLSNLRSQAQAYAQVDRKFKKLHPQWMSWRELQWVRRGALCRFEKSSPELKTEELCRKLVIVIIDYTLALPFRCSIIRDLVYGDTLRHDREWSVDLTKRSSQASRHKTHMSHGATKLPLLLTVFPYLDLLHDEYRCLEQGCYVFFNSHKASYTSSGWIYYVKSCFRTFESKKAPAAGPFEV